MRGRWGGGGWRGVVIESDVIGSDVKGVMRGAMTRGTQQEVRDGGGRKGT